MSENEKRYPVRFNLKTECGENRQKLIDSCLNINGKHLKEKSNAQYLAIGWSSIYDEKKDEFKNYDEYYNAVADYVHSQIPKKHINHALNVFRDAKEKDLFWTRDLDGFYWICKVISEAEQYCNKSLDIGAILPIKAYKVGLEVPGQIKASFNRPRGGIAQKIEYELILKYSKFIFNEMSQRVDYEVKIPDTQDIICNLPDFELEELVISYIQLVEGYYVLSNSIANKSTTIKIECEFIHRKNGNKAVVQVKGGNKKELDANDFKEYTDNGYTVFLYAPNVKNSDKLDNVVEITRYDLMNFYKNNRDLLPDSITKWENLFK